MKLNKLILVVVTAIVGIVIIGSVLGKTAKNYAEQANERNNQVASLLEQARQ